MLTRAMVGRTRWQGRCGREAHMTMPERPARLNVRVRPGPWTASGETGIVCGVTPPLHAPVSPPDGTRTGRVLLRPLRATDVDRDYDAVMASREQLRRWGQT